TPQFWSHTLPQLAIKALQRNKADPWLFAKLIVDEAQDILTSNFIDCLDLFLDRGLLGGEFILLGDFENQGVFSCKVISVGDLRTSLVPDLAFYRLDENCRNRPRIGDTAKIIGRMHRGYSRYLREDDRIDPVIKYFAHKKQSEELLRWAIK